MSLAPGRGRDGIMQQVSVRRFREDDTAATAQLYFDAVHRGARDHYDEAQRKAWAPQVPEAEAWRERLTCQTTLVAERDAKVVGFMTLQPDGYIDLAFVAPETMGRGVARQLYEAVLAEAARMGVRRLHTQASYLARRFFERQGWTVAREQNLSRDGVSVTNFVMEKHLPE